MHVMQSNFNSHIQGVQLIKLKKSVKDTVDFLNAHVLGVERKGVHTTAQLHKTPESSSATHFAPNII